MIWGCRRFSCWARGWLSWVPGLRAALCPSIPTATNMLQPRKQLVAGFFFFSLFLFLVFPAFSHKHGYPLTSKSETTSSSLTPEGLNSWPPDQEPSSPVAWALFSAFSFLRYFWFLEVFILFFRTGDVYYCCAFGTEQKGTLKHELTVPTWLKVFYENNLISYTVWDTSPLPPRSTPSPPLKALWRVDQKGDWR